MPRDQRAVVASHGNVTSRLQQSTASSASRRASVAASQNSSVLAKDSAKRAVNGGMPRPGSGERRVGRGCACRAVAHPRSSACILHGFRCSCLRARAAAARRSRPLQRGGAVHMSPWGLGYQPPRRRKKEARGKGSPSLLSFTPSARNLTWCKPHSSGSDHHEQPRLWWWHDCVTNGALDPRREESDRSGNAAGPD
jgi:hypothetical protein